MSSISLNQSLFILFIVVLVAVAFSIGLGFRQRFSTHPEPHLNVEKLVDELVEINAAHSDGLDRVERLHKEFLEELREDFKT